eukprot:m.64242 g.64242  ORF g.64242 m.64242 type:complete len:625 (-) comp11995_c0_seq1:314-2188(-)
MSSEGKTADPRLKREERRKAKALEEARKLGNAPAAVDEEGRDINPHIPQYITKVPWWFESTGPTLRHQRVPEDKKQTKRDVREVTKKGIIRGSGATRYRKGACANCGAMTHKAKDCLSRPRKVGAKYTGEDIAPDEYIPDQSGRDFDGKRDRWQDYDVAEHKKLIEEFAKVEQEKKRIQAEKLKQDALEKKSKMEELKRRIEAGEDVVQPDEAGASDSETDEEDADQQEKDELKYSEEANMAGSKVDAKRRITVRNLRIREDTAKYLLNLDVNSAHYDPKTRSMRGNPLAHTGKDPKDLHYAGDNFVRYTGDVPAMAERQLFAWDAAEKGSSLHLQADPTLAELAHKKFKVKKDEFEKDQRSAILEKYHGQEHLQAPPKELLLAQTEQYVEYSQSGRVIKGQERQKISSRYEENVHPGNHTSVWGSYWVDGKWGFACCHALTRGAYCTGEAGKRARAVKPTDMLAQQKGQQGGEAGSEAQAQAQEETEAPVSLMEQHKELKEKEKERKASAKAEKRRKQKRKHKGRRGSDSDGASSSSSSSSSSSDSDSEDEARNERRRQRKIKKYMKKHKAQDAEAERTLAMGDRARPFNSGKGDSFEVTEEELEAYRLAKGRADDPMAQFMS